MSETTVPVPQWKLMLSGSASAVGRRILVAALAVLALAAWTVTVVGSGVFRCGATPRAAEAASTAASLADPVLVLAQGRHGAAAQPVALATAAASLEMPVRDVFAASEAHFPRAKIESAVKGVTEVARKEGSRPEAAVDGSALGRGQVALLQVEGTLLGKDKKAMVVGNALNLDGQLKVICRSGGEGPGAILPAGSSSRWRVGEELDVRSVASGDGHYRLGEQRDVVQVKDVTSRGVVLTFNTKDYILEMGK